MRQTDNRTDTRNRREFLKSGFRYALFGGLVVMGTALGLRQTVEGESCSYDWPCRDCSSLKDCRDRKAVEYREIHGGSDGLDQD